MVRQVASEWYKMMCWAIYLTLILTGFLRTCMGDQEELFACPERFGYFVDREDCSKYYVCVFDKPLHESCAGGLYFSLELQTCDWPRNVECPLDRNSPDPPKIVTSAPPADVFDPNRRRPTSTDTNQVSSRNVTRTVDRRQVIRSTTTTTTTTTAAPITSVPTHKSLYDLKEESVSDDPLYNGKTLKEPVDPYDPQLPEFGEAVPPIVDSEGGIHLVDGPIDTHGSVPRIPGVNVFVKQITDNDKRRPDVYQTRRKIVKDNPPLPSNNGHSKDPDVYAPIHSNNGKPKDPDVNRTIVSHDYTDDFEATRKKPPSVGNQPRHYVNNQPPSQYDPIDYGNKKNSTTKSPSYFPDYDTSPARGYSDYYSDDEYDTRQLPTTTTTQSTVLTTTAATPSVRQQYPHRPKSINPTPSPYSLATRCDPKTCVLPDCRCGGIDIPGGLPANQVPQIVLLTFDDAINDLNFDLYHEIFLTGRKNPNGCPILGTFYVSHEWTDYGQVQTLYSKGHEIASHSITHSYGEKFSKLQWLKEIQGQREILHKYGGVKLEDIRGMRAPFLQIGGNRMFDMLYESNFTYDASMPIFENDPPFWPYTLDYSINHECMITPCPTKSYPGMWELGLVMWLDLRGGRCSMADACSNPQDEEGIVKMLTKNFNRHYRHNRAPFGLFYHSAWFNTQHHRRGFMKFLDKILDKQDVWFVTNWQLIQWIRNPTPLDNLANFEPWQCGRKKDLPAPCPQPTVCNVWYQGGLRYMKTCQPCPTEYPWVTQETET